jgi:hypothetical protein
MIMMEKSEIWKLKKKGKTPCVCTQRHQGGRRWGWERCDNEGTNLFVDRVTLSEYEVTTEQPRKKGIMRSSLPTVQFPLKDKQRLVDRDEFC